MDIAQLNRAQLNRLAGDETALGPRISTRLCPDMMLEFDRLRSVRRYSRAEALREAAWLWMWREMTREVRYDSSPPVRQGPLVERDEPASGPRLSTRLHVLAMTQFERLRAVRGVSCAQALREGVGQWVVREIHRDARNERVKLLREVRQRREEITRRIDRKIAKLREGLGGW
jgi:hypothetical protein